MSATAVATTPGAAEKPGNFPLRKRTGTAHWQLRSDLLDTSLDELHKLSPVETVQLAAELRWGSSTFISCPHCETMDRHYWRRADMRWKCAGCDKCFSVTSGTVFADRKLSLNKLLRMCFQWSNRASGHVAMDMRKDYGVTYRTAFTLCQKLREGLFRGFNTGVLCGVLEMDGADLNGKRYREKRNQPQVRKKKKPAIEDKYIEKVDPHTGEIFGPEPPAKFGKAARQPADRRIMLTLRKRGQVKGNGAIATRVCIALTEAGQTVQAMATRFATASSAFMTDEDPSYAKFGIMFSAHDTVSHSETYSTDEGVNNNQAESFNRRMRRSAEGIYLNVSNKYLTSYSAENAWREDLRRTSTFQRLKSLMGFAFGVGLSEWWRGYWQGKYRTHELLIEGARDAPARGKKKGAPPKKPA